MENLLNKNERVFFEPVTHTYLLDGKTLLPGVTELMKKHGLQPDYSAVRQDVLDNAAALGSELHKEIEDYDNGVTVLRTELLDDYKALGLKFIANEYLVSDNETVASFIDGVYEGKWPSEVILVDYKFTSKVHTRSLQWQLSIYKVLFERQNPSLAVKELYCLHGDKKRRRIDALIPIEFLGYDKVDALLEAEREGRIYTDECTDVSAVISEEEIQDYAAGIAAIKSAESAIAEIKERMKPQEARILAYMQEHRLEKLPGCGGVFSFKKGYERTTVDAAKLREQYPSIAEKLSKTTYVNPSISFKLK